MYHTSKTQLTFISKSQMPLIMYSTIYIDSEGEVYDGVCHWTVNLPSWIEKLLLKYYWSKK